MREGRQVYRNYTYTVFGVGVDAIVVLVTVLGGNLVAGAAFVPVLILGARWATIRVVLDARGVRAVNLWRTRRLAWSEVDRFMVNQRNLERYNRWGRFRAFLGLVSVQATDGREISLSATSAAGTFTPVERVPDRWLPALVERLNRAVPAPAAGR
jgi:hypothetical protein